MCSPGAASLGLLVLRVEIFKFYRIPFLIREEPLTRHYSACRSDTGLVCGVNGQIHGAEKCEVLATRQAHTHTDTHSSMVAEMRPTAARTEVAAKAACSCRLPEQQSVRPASGGDVLLLLPLLPFCSGRPL